VVSALLVSKSSWSNLLQRTSLSKNTLSAVLKDLKKSGDLSYSLSDSKDGMPNIVYALSEAGRKKYSNIVSALDKIKNVEQFVDQITEETLFFNPDASREKVISRYSKIMLKAALAAFETAMLEWGESGPPAVEALISTSLASARRILFLQGIPTVHLEAIKENLKVERDILILELQKEAAQVGPMVPGKK
jgi:DNA-binding PadR family transcriptional regulator